MARPKNKAIYRVILRRWIDAILMCITALSVYLVFGDTILSQLERVATTQETPPTVVLLLISSVFVIAFWLALLKLGSITPKTLFSRVSLRNPPIILVGIVGFFLYLGCLCWTGKYSWICETRVTALWTGVVIVVFIIGGMIASAIRKMWRTDVTKVRESGIRTGTSLSEITEDPTKLIKWIEREIPIDSPEEDVLDGAIFAKRILRLLRKHPVQAIGVVGPYGCGKSSILNLVAHYIKHGSENSRGQDTSDEETLWPVDKMLLCWVKGWGQTEGNAAQHILRAAVDELSRYTDCVGLEDIPRKYRAAMMQPAGVLGRVVNAFIGLNTNPKEILRRIDTVLRRAGKRLIVIIEDVDRNWGGEGFFNEIGALLDNLKDLQNISFVLAIGREFRGQELTIKLTEQVETIPHVPRGYFLPILRNFRKYCLGLHLKDIDCLSQEKREERTQFDRLPDIDRLAMVESLLQNTIDYAGRLLLTPRILKMALRRTWHAWATLHGEIDFDDLLICSILRVGAPEAFMFVNENVRILQSLREESTSSTGKDRDKINREKLNKQFKDRVKDATWDMVAARALIEVLFQGWKEGMIRRYVDTSQGVNTYHPTDYWSRLNKEDLESGEIRDQEVLHAISQWKSSHSTKEFGNPNEQRNENESELAKLICEKDKFAEKVEQFGCMFEGSEVRCLASEVFAKILRENKSASQGKDQEAFISLWRLSLYKNIKAEKHEEWVAKEVEKALPVSLRFANDIYYFWRSQDKGVRHEWPTLELRKRVIDLAKKIYIGNEDVLSKVVDITYPYSIYHLVVLFGQNDFGGPGLEKEEWSWIGPILIEGCKKNPNVFVPAVSLLAGDEMSPFRKGTWERNFELCPDRIKKIFGDETKSLMQLLTTRVDLTPLEPQTKLIVEDARQKIANWVSENQDV